MAPETYTEDKRMHKIAMAILWLCTTGQTFAQQQTEIFIPIGESPGLSGLYTDVGRILGFDAGSGVLSLAAGGGTRPVQTSAETAIWLDRSKAKLRNESGDVSDLVSGRRAEIKYLDPAKRDSAAWVKVETDN